MSWRGRKIKKGEILSLNMPKTISFISFLMPFEFDPDKSASNLHKHGIDFVAAQVLWEDLHRVETSAWSSNEPRFQVVGTIDGKIWSAFITYRGENIRIISVRRARDEEEEQYHGEQK
jgi:uncharacterized protein